MGLHVYEGEDGGSYVGRRVEGGSKRRINTLTDAQSPVDDDAGRANEQPVEVPLHDAILPSTAAGEVSTERVLGTLKSD